MESAGQRLLELRQKRGLTQTELGQMVGISSMQVRRYEKKGIRTMRVHRLYDLAAALDCSVADILGLALDESVRDQTSEQRLEKEVSLLRSELYRARRENLAIRKQRERLLKRLRELNPEGAGVFESKNPGSPT